MTNRLLELEGRQYPQTWLLLDVAERSLRFLGQEVVDLSPGAIELRHAARELRRFAEDPARWLPLTESVGEDRLSGDHRRRLSFGPSVSYCVERDQRDELHAGRPFRHLQVAAARGLLTPATAAEIGLYFYGRRPATFGFVRPDTAHGFIGLDWEELPASDVGWLLQREIRGLPR